MNAALAAVRCIQRASIRHPQGTYTAELRGGVVYVRLCSTDAEEEEALIIDDQTVIAAESTAVTHPELIDELTRRGFVVQWVDGII